MSDSEAEDRITKIKKVSTFYEANGKFPEDVKLDDFEMEYLEKHLKRK
jgi:hypothetical protein